MSLKKGGDMTIMACWRGMVDSRVTKTLQLSGAGMQALPAQLATMAWLTELDLSHNQLMELDQPIFALAGLRRLSAAHNRLVAVPPEVARLTRYGSPHYRLMWPNRSFTWPGSGYSSSYCRLTSPGSPGTYTHQPTNTRAQTHSHTRSKYTRARVYTPPPPSTRAHAEDVRTHVRARTRTHPRPLNTTRTFDPCRLWSLGCVGNMILCRGGGVVGKMRTM